tara:strand:+ start:120 stop:869 length:750 start_codon:yes stop_codon:yes gene_type:complete
MSEVKVDTISERTAAGGVTIDGVLLKDSIVNTDNIAEKTAAAGVTIDGVLVKDGVATFQTAAGSPLVFEGATANAFETTFAITDPTADRTITFPDADVTLGASGDNTPSFRASGGYTAAASGTWYTMQLSNESWDTDNAFDTSTYRFTVPVGKGGKYVISYDVTANTASAGQRVIGRVDKNGSDSDATMVSGSPGASSQRVNAVLTMILELDAGDYIELKGQQNRGVDYDFRSGETWMAGYKLIGIDDA